MPRAPCPRNIASPWAKISHRWNGWESSGEFTARHVDACVQERLEFEGSDDRVLTCLGLISAKGIGWEHHQMDLTVVGWLAAC